MNNDDKVLYEHLLIAGSSAACAEFITFPIDTVKVYLQLQTKITGSNPHIPTELEVGSAHSGLKSGYTHHTKKLGVINLLDSAQKIYINHGIRGYYRGYKPAIIRATLNNALSATLYKPVRRMLGSTNRDCPFHIKLLSGFLTGSFTQIIASPTDLLKVRMQADATRREPRYNGFADAINKIYTRYGIRAFWKGVIPSMCRAGLSVAATLGTYDQCKATLLSKNAWDGITDRDHKLHFICAICSGFLATALAIPFDVVKTRYQSQSLQNPIYRSSRHCLQTIVKEQGLSVLCSGFVPMYCRLGPWQMTFFMVFETLQINLMGESF